MKRLLLSLLLSLTLFAGVATARPHPIHFIMTHKVWLATSVEFVAADMVDTRTTINAQHRCPTCVETSDLYGPHPSATRLWSESSVFDAGYVIFDWFGTRDTGLTGTKDFTPEEKAKHPVLYKLCYLEKPTTVAVMLVGTAGHARAAYYNTQIR
jgi:hypothetical protein